MEDKVKSIIKNGLGEKEAKLFKMILSQKPEKVDVIVFLQGDKFDRCEKALSLYQKDFSDKLLISGNNVREDVIGTHDSYLRDIKKWFLDHGVKEEDVIIEDKSLNTLDQAINIIKMAKLKNWKKLILVTSPYHVLRVYLTFMKQIKDQSWEGKIIMQATDQLWSDVPSGDDKTALEMLIGETEKIKNYDLL